MSSRWLNLANNENFSRFSGTCSSIIFENCSLASTASLILIWLSAVSFTNIFENFSFDDLFSALSTRALGFNQLAYLTIWCFNGRFSIIWVVILDNICENLEQDFLCIFRFSSRLKDEGSHPYQHQEHQEACESFCSEDQSSIISM